MEEKAIEFRDKLAELCEEYGLIPTQNEFEEYFIEPINDDLLLDLKTASIEVDED